MSQNKLTEQEKLDKLQQKINKMQAEQKRLKRKIENDERKQRDHNLILFAAHILSKFDDEIKKEVDTFANDSDVRKVAEAVFAGELNTYLKVNQEKHIPETEKNNEAAETQQYEQPQPAYQNGTY